MWRWFSPALMPAVLAAPVMAAVNPSLQPADLSDQYRSCISAKVKEVDTDNQVVRLTVQEVLAGEFAPKTVSLRYGVVKSPAHGDDLGEVDAAASPADFQPGQVIVAWVMLKARGEAGTRVLTYVGDRQWHDAAVIPAAEPDQWQWKALAEESMVGTFNGQIHRLLDMLRDARSGRHFFPAVVFAQFKDDQVLGTYDGPLGGVALYDLDRDGRSDALAATPKGVKVLLQKQPNVFTDASGALGLGGVNARTLAVADVNADGRADLLLDGRLYLQGEGGFTASSLLPDPAPDPIKVSTFADLNGDGYPDVLISTVGHGLRTLINPGPDDAGGGFRDQTEALGLAVAPEGNGYIALGDWNLDGRIDLFYATGKGLLLEQQRDGRFVAVAHRLPLDFRGGARLEAGRCGAGMFAPVWRPDRMDLVLPLDGDMAVLTREDGQIVDVTGFGNEIALGTIAQSGTLLEDLDMDGYVDLLTFSHAPDGSLSYHTNRGYGSFMHAQLYKPDFWPGRSYQTGAGGLAAGDVDGDGANDVLIGGLDGRLVLVRSDVLSLRAPVERSKHHEAVLQRTALLTVHVTGVRGVTGATVRVLDAAGELVAMRNIGLAVLTGCRGPDAATIAVRQPGTHRVVVRFSDGTEAEASADLKPREHGVIRVAR